MLARRELEPERRERVAAPARADVVLRAFDAVETLRLGRAALTSFFAAPRTAFVALLITLDERVERAFEDCVLIGVSFSSKSMSSIVDLRS
jgi:hypothetical protein